MSSTEKLQVLHSDVSELKKLPKIATGFYIILFDEGWPTVASKVVGECHEVLGRELHEHMIIVAGPNLRKLLRPIYNIKTKDDPIIVLTDIYPKDFDKKTHKANGIWLSLANMTDRNSIVDYLRQVADTVNDPDFLSSMAWFDRRNRLKKLLEKVPIFELIGLL